MYASVVTVGSLLGGWGVNIVQLLVAGEGSSLADAVIAAPRSLLTGFYFLAPLAALYGMLYTVGRGFIEMLRIDDANYILGLRLNVWTSVIVFAGSAFALWRLGVRGQGAQEEVGGERGKDPAPDGAPRSQHLD